MFSYRSKEVGGPQTQTTTISKLNEKKKTWTRFIVRVYSHQFVNV